MLDDQLRHVPVSATPHSALRAAQVATAVAALAAHDAIATAVRGQAVAASARRALDAFATLDARASSHCVVTIWADAGRPGLSSNLVEASRSLAVARQDLANAEAAATQLDSEAVEAQQMADVAAAAVTACDNELIGDALATLAAMRVAEAGAAKLRLSLMAFINNRNLSAASLPEALRLIGQGH